MARASEARRSSVAQIAGQNATAQDFDAVIELLDDPSIDVRDAALALLAQGGQPAREAAEARLKDPLLPELRGSIEKFLATPPSTPNGAVTLR